MKPLEAGARYRGEVQPGPADLASALGNTGVDVVSSPAIIGYLEMACHAVLDEHLEAGEATVGFGFNFKHLAAAYPGKALQVDAQLISQDGRRLKFKVEARQEDRLIMTGEHERVLIQLASFLDKAKP